MSEEEIYCPNVGDILFAKWCVPAQDSVMGPIIQGRKVMVTAMDAESITVMPCEPEQTSRFPYDKRGHPTVRTEEGTIIVFLPIASPTE
jgi:hypothetical protein